MSAKASSTVLRGGESGDARTLPDQNPCAISVTAKNLAIDWLNYSLDEGESPSL